MGTSGDKGGIVWGVKKNVYANSPWTGGTANTQFSHFIAVSYFSDRGHIVLLSQE